MKLRSTTKFVPSDRMVRFGLNTGVIPMQQLSPEQDRLLTPEEVAEILRLRSPRTLEFWRKRGRLPLPYVRVGRLIRYRVCDVEQFIEDRLFRLHGGRDESE